MSERLVEIPVNREIRTKIKEIKGVLSYSEFFEKIIIQDKIHQRKNYVHSSHGPGIIPNQAQKR